MKRRSLGQHYLVDAPTVDRIVALAKLRGTEAVLEIGTGRGVLTAKLADLCPRLEAYEIDRENYNETRRRLKGSGARVHLEDAFERPRSFDVLVSSLPYSRSADFVEWMSEATYSRAVVLLQDDFVKKVLTPPGGRDYRAVSAIAQIAFEMKVVGSVARSSFSPPPRVGSSIVVIEPKTRLLPLEVQRIKRLFSLRRREVASALARLGMGRGESTYGRRRVYSLTPFEVYELCASDPQVRDLSSVGPGVV